VSVVVPTFRRPRLLARLLDSLAAQDVGGDHFEVVVVDDGSGDETPEVLAGRARPGWRWEARPANRGPAAARNRGVELARGRWILFLDDDIVAPPGLVREHLGWLRAGDDRLGVVGLVEWWPGLEITPFMAWLDGTDAQFSFPTLSEGPVVPASRAFYTCNVSLSRSCLEAAGGFDERFRHPAYEDAELAVRLEATGFHLDYRPSALAWHARPVTLDAFVERMEKVGESAVLLSRLHPELDRIVDIDAPPAGWRRRAGRGMARAGGPLLARSPLRRRYYAVAVSAAYHRGVARAKSQVGPAEGRRSR